jgi:uncharacterized protein with PIN domain
MEKGNAATLIRSCLIDISHGLGEERAATMLAKLNAMKSWGIQVGSPGVIYSKDHLRCPNPNCRESLPMTLSGQIPQIRGYTERCEHHQSKFTYECSHCGKYFWSHASEAVVRAVKKSCPQWGKTSQL